jgi:hypothetical protein
VVEDRDLIRVCVEGRSNLADQSSAMSMVPGNPFVGLAGRHNLGENF